MKTVNMLEWRVLTFFQHYVEAHGCSPTIGETMKGCGIVRMGDIWIALSHMESVGVLTWKRNEAIELLPVTVGVQP